MVNLFRKFFAKGIIPGLLVLLFTCAQENSFAQRSGNYYYSRGEKIYGKMDTSIVALQIPKDFKRASYSSVIDSMQGKYLDESIDYVKAFQQEGISFIKISKPADVVKNKLYYNQFMRISPNTVVGHPFFIEDEKYPVIVTDEFIVRFKTDIKEADIEKFNRSKNIQVVKKNPHHKSQYLLKVAAGGKINALEMANQYYESNNVDFALPNFLLHIEYNHTPKDPGYLNQWHLNNTGGGGMTAGADIDAEAAWDITRGDPGVIIAVIDGGFDITHTDLDDNLLINTPEQAGVAGIDDDGNGYVDDINGWSFVDTSDDLSIGLWPYHGQCVAGLVAAEENGLDAVGVCPRARILLICNTFNTNDLANAFYYARDRGADIITNSWTASELDPLITALRETANGTRGGLGIPIFFATGNAGIATVSYPARDTNTIAVGGSDCKDEKYTGSQYGPELDFLSTTRQGDGTCGLVTLAIGGGMENNFGGTSGATPIAAGIGGLLLSLNPNLTRQQVERIMEETAEKIEPTVANYNVDGISNTHGHGRVNARRALVPTVKIAVSKKKVKVNESFTVKVAGSAPYGLTAIWWFGEGTGIPDLDKAHWFNVPVSEPVYIYEWTDVKIDKEGTFNLGSNARDVLYPNPGDGYPHQASEGSGLAYTTIKVTPVFGLLSMLITVVLIAGYLKHQDKRKLCKA
jgi:subtilisin family serine protease